MFELKDLLLHPLFLIYPLMVIFFLLVEIIGCAKEKIRPARKISKFH